MDPDVAQWRKTTRARLTLLRLGMDDGARRRCGDAITARLIAHLSPFGTRSLGFYWPHRGEYDPLPVVRRILREGGRAALPVVTQKGGPLEFRPWNAETAMAVGAYGIPHPAEGVAAAPDVVLVPALGFDEAGYRLGYGGGYYDRTFAAEATRPVMIGVGFAFGRLDSIRPQLHDVRMDFIISEDGAFEVVEDGLRRIA